MSSEIKTYSISNIGDLTNVVNDGTRLFNNRMFWWRGQSDKDWKVQPSLYHKGLSHNEANMAVRFVNYGRVRHSDVPNRTDGPAWLFLMQHYGLPTRLLDWSRSPLTALHFAVKELDHHACDGVVWGIQPTLLNKSLNGIESVLGSDNPVVRPVFSGAWQCPPNESSKKDVLAINAQHVDVRQMVQASEFTIHGTEKGISDLSSANEYMIKIIIPYSVKTRLLNSLKLFYITDSYLFPDLEHLAKDLVKAQFL